MVKVKFFKNHDFTHSKSKLLPFPLNNKSLIYGWAVRESDISDWNEIHWKIKWREIKTDCKTKIYALDFKAVTNYLIGKDITKPIPVPFDPKKHCVKIIKEEITQLDLLNMLSGIGPIVKGRKSQVSGIEIPYLIIVVKYEQIDGFIQKYVG